MPSIPLAISILAQLAVTSSEIAAWALAVLSAGLLVMAVVVAKNPNLVGKGQDAAGKGMAAGCTVLLACVAAFALGVVATIVAFNADPPVSLAARIAALTPVVMILGAIVVAVVASQLAKARRMDAEWVERMKIPIYVLVDSSDERLTGMYNALRTLDATTEMRLYSNSMAFWWQHQDHLPRARLLCLAAEGMDKVDEVERVSLLGTLERWKPPAYPILLHACTTEAIEKVRPRLAAAGWTVRAVVGELDPAANPEWLGEARRLIPGRNEEQVETSGQVDRA